MNKEQYVSIFDDLKKCLDWNRPLLNDLERVDLLPSDSPAWQKISLVCEEFMRGDEASREEILSLLDAHIRWIFNVYIQNEIDFIKSQQDARHLRLGLAAIAIVGDYCDPRDVAFWALRLHRQGMKYQIQEAGAFFEAASLVASKQINGSSIGATTVSGLLGEYATG